MSETATGEIAPPTGAVGPSDPAEGRVRLPVAVLVVAAAVVLSLLLVALVVRLDADRLPTAPPRDPPAAPEAATRLSVADREVSLEELSVRLPGPPFTCSPAVEPPPTGFAQLVGCSSVVHEDYDGQGHDWGAAAGVALVSDSSVRPDLAATTSDAFDAVVSALYSAADRPTFAKQSDGPSQVPGSSGTAWTQQADVRVQRKGLPTPYDRLVVIVVRLESGRHVVFFSDFPHDGSKQALQAVVDSVGTLEARR